MQRTFRRSVDLRIDHNPRSTRFAGPSFIGDRLCRCRCLSAVAGVRDLDAERATGPLRLLHQHHGGCALECREWREWSKRKTRWIGIGIGMVIETSPKTREALGWHSLVCVPVLSQCRGWHCSQSGLAAWPFGGSANS